MQVCSRRWPYRLPSWRISSEGGHTRVMVSAAVYETAPGLTAELGFIHPCAKDLRLLEAFVRQPANAADPQRHCCFKVIRCGERSPGTGQTASPASKTFDGRSPISRSIVLPTRSVCAILYSSRWKRAQGYSARCRLIGQEHRNNGSTSSGHLAAS